MRNGLGASLIEVGFELFVQDGTFHVDSVNRRAEHFSEEGLEGGAIRGKPKGRGLAVQLPSKTLPLLNESLVLRRNIFSRSIFSAAANNQTVRRTI
jgi:hypothetical protein